MSTKGLRHRWIATIHDVRGRAHVGARRSRGAVDLAFAREIASSDVPDGPPVAQVMCDLLDHAPFGFALLDDQGRYRMVNARLAALGRRLAWVTFLVAFFSGLLGMGMFTSVPQTVVMLLMMGWYVVARKRAPVPIAVSVPRRRLGATPEGLGTRP